MSETPEQFRKRIAKVSFSAERPHTGLRVFTAAEHDRHQDMAEAVYAQALRDVIAEFTSPEYMDTAAEERILEFAAERGIEVGGEQ